jgi:predicted adenylyl cyclase CyaB
MPAEIEIKAWLDDHDAVEAQLHSMGSFVRRYEKNDAYWFPKQDGNTGVPSTFHGVRIRRELGEDCNGAVRETVLVTVKDKTIADGMEVNDEREFSVSDARLFEELLCSLGLIKAMSKQKNGREWKVPTESENVTSVCAEVSLVKDLGWFLELEIIAANRDDNTVKESRGVLLTLLKKLGVLESKIEGRSYNSLLADFFKSR